MTRVLIVDDSETARLALRMGLEADGSVTVVGEATTGEEAVREIRRVHPDLVTMDVYLRRENGLDVAATIMRECATPILVVTGANIEDPQLLYRAMNSGALEVFPKLPAPTRHGYERQRTRLLRLVKALAQVPVIHRHRRAKTGVNGAPELRPGRESRLRALVIGASTGGPPVLQKILSQLSAPFPFPIVIAQHLSAGFTAGLASWLSSTTGHDVSVVTGRARMQGGGVYLANDDQHITFEAIDRLLSSAAPEEMIARPSIDLLFRSAAKQLGPSVAAVLLTGMGRDGAAGLSELHGLGSPTLVQRPDSCAVDSMPRSAIKEGAARFVLTPQEIGQQLEHWGRNNAERGETMQSTRTRPPAPPPRSTPI